jgi:hydrogenase expression/formation protein HypE
LYGILHSVLDAVPPSAIKVMRDPTRGGLATTLNEFVQKSAVGIRIEESSIPVRNDVQALCEMAGYDPLYIANEGKAIIVVSEAYAERVVSILHDHELGKNAKIIGIVTKENTGSVVLKTAIGGERIVDMLTGDMFPRIC